MSEVITKTTAVLTGDTFRVKGILKKNGWKWDADRKAWTMSDAWDNADHVIRRVRGYGGIRNRGTFAAELIAE